MSNPLHILLVEGNEEEFLLTKELLRSWCLSPLDLEWVTTSDRALAVMRRNQHDIYLVNDQIGEEDGLLLLRTSLAQGCQGQGALSAYFYSPSRACVEESGGSFVTT